MDTERLIKGNWYSAIYECGFKVVEIEGNSMTFCRKDGVEVESLPSGYLEIINNGTVEPGYE